MTYATHRSGVCLMALILPLLAAAILYQSCQVHAQASGGQRLTPTIAAHVPSPLPPVAPGASGGGQPLPRGEQRLADAIAVVAAHEGALVRLADVDLVAQTAYARASSVSGRVRFLEQHSGRALGVKPCTESNCKWSAQLSGNPGTLPTVAPELVDYWRVVAWPRWLAVRARAEAIVRGDVVANVCLVAPYTWGGAMDHAGSAARGLVRIECRGTLNSGYVLAGKTISARDAR